MQPTSQQAAFLTALTTTDSHLCLQARAGCGKTTAILMGVEAYSKAFPSSEQLVCAYNKAIADEVAGKLKARGYDWQKVQAATLHSLGFGLVRYIFKPTVDDKKVSKLIWSHSDRGEPVYREYGAQISSLVGYAKQAGVGFFDDLQAAPEAPLGSILRTDSLPDDLAPGDAILCRNTAPLIQLAYSLIRSGKACKVEGRKIGEGLATLAQRWKVSSTDALRIKLEIYCDREQQKRLAEGARERIWPMLP
jgi:hypothetical protein